MTNAGLTELYRGERPAVEHVSRFSPRRFEALLMGCSIVAVHGLNGDPFRSWTTEASEKMWLKDPNLLPSNLKDSWILTYGYNAVVASLFGKASSDRILQHAHTLVAELIADRELEDAAQRPIMFICHSLGGIIVKRALAYSASRTSKSIEHVHSIYVSTFAILFFGTPHDGSSKAKLASTNRRMVGALVPSKIVDTEGQLLDALQEGSEVLQNITDMFAPLTKNFHIFFFWEQEKTNMGFTQDYVRLFPNRLDLVNANIWKVVEESSAAPILDNAERAGLPYDHRNMCRFENLNSPGYRLVVAALIRYSKEAPEVISERWKHTIDMLRSKRSQEAAELLR